MNDWQSRAPRPRWSLIDADTRRIVVDDLRIADGYWSKMAGLQFRAPIPIGSGLLLIKEASIHTFWMRFAIDLAFISGEGVVLGIRRAVRPWRMVVGAPGTHAILETRAGWAELEAGMRLAASWEDSRGEFRERRSLRFLRTASHKAEAAIQARRTNEARNITGSALVDAVCLPRSACAFSARSFRGRL